jgi:HEAT repeat protein
MATDMSRAWLSEKNARIKMAQAYALYRMGRKEFLDELVRGLGNGKTNSEARALLLEFKREELPELYAQAKNNDANVREGLAEIYGLIGDERALPVLQNLAGDRRGQIAVLASQAMRRINARLAR